MNDKLKLIWQALPDSAPFDSHFGRQLETVANCQRRLDEAEVALVEAKQSLSNAQRFLVMDVRREMHEQWSTKDIAKATETVGGSL